MEDISFNNHYFYLPDLSECLKDKKIVKLLKYLTNENLT